jgi:O-antigen/teichoic acid export membrane protein
MSQYQGDDRLNIIISWFLFCIINTYNIYTLYYDALLMGFGYVKLSKQYIIISQLVYLFLTILMIYMDFGILSIVVAQGVSLIVRRILIYRLLSIGNLKQHLTTRKSTQIKEVIQAIYPNAIKLGLTGLGAFLVLNSSVLLGSAFISLPEIGSYSISVQVVNVIASLSMVYFNSYIPKLTQLRVRNDVREIRRLYHRSILILILTYFTGGFLLILAGQPILHLLGSQTNLLSSVMLFTILLISLLEKNHAMAGGVLLLKNEVPFYKAAIISGIATVIVLYVFLHFLDYGIWAMILAPGLVQIAYQNWKWPLKLNKEIKQEIYG